MPSSHVASSDEDDESLADSHSRLTNETQRVLHPSSPEDALTTFTRSFKLLLMFSLLALSMLATGYFLGETRGVALEKERENVVYNPASSPSVPAASTPSTHFPQFLTKSPSGPPKKVQGTKTPTAEPTKETPAYEVAFLRQARGEASFKLKFLEAYYGEFAGKVLEDGGLMFEPKDKDVLAQKSFNRIKDIYARAIVYQEQVNFGFIGSSVMCGHDNCYEDSFPSVLESMISEVLVMATGEPPDFRNACQGGGCGDSFQNQIFCVRHLVGDDVDFLFYEWTYFENDFVQSMLSHELITRWAAMLPKIPSTTIFNCDARYGYGPMDMNNGVEEPAWPLKWHYRERWAPFGANSIGLTEGLSNNGLYKGKEWGRVGDGMHNSSRFGNMPNASEARKAHSGVVFVNWHPGPLGLQFVADKIANLHLQALIKAIDEVLVAGDGGVDKWPRIPNREILKIPDFPPSMMNLMTAYKLADVAGLSEEAPGCYTANVQHFGKSQVTLADNPNDPLNPYKNEVRPLVPDGKAGTDPLAWRLNIARNNWDMVPQRLRGDEGCLPPDRCGYMLTPKENPSAPIVFRLPKMEVGMVFICGFGGYAANDKLKNMEVEIDGKRLNSSTFESNILGYNKCMRVQSKFDGPLDDASGHIYMAVYFNTTGPNRWAGKNGAIPFDIASVIAL